MKQRPWRMALARALHWEKDQQPVKQAERKLVDRYILRVKGGHGGGGCNSFAKSLSSRHGRVNGGNGGIGGKVILKSTPEVYDFKNLQHAAAGGNGGSGLDRKQTGKRGLDEVLYVPLGTVVHLSEGTLPDMTQDFRQRVARRTVKQTWDGDKDWVRLSQMFSKDIYSHRPDHPPPPQETSEEPEETSDDSDLDEDEDEEEDDDDDGASSSSSEDAPRVLKIPRPIIRSNVAELLEPNQTLVVAVGGAGGRGNAALPRSLPKKSKWPNGLPRLENEPGEPGSEAVLILELKSIADVGLVGAPNAGKSTLLGSMSKAKPCVGSYPFTTLRPIIGRVEFPDYYCFSVADVPGLIEGAHENRGLGFHFLRHVERTKVFVYVLDASLGVAGREGDYAWDQLEQLKYEMECYRSGMTKRRSIVVANKMDEEGAEEVVRELRRRTDLPVYPVCAVLGEGVEELKEGMRQMVECDDGDAPDLQELKI
ncbi:probable GTP-binding protein OBGM, mitochondrial [Selaginella moellendorffii]|uniref:probable GTP-binding protein OBGM, mitochondrial n=1 Tax=Selaginella moellendorffii TaxID=88036 RepID=UPI000D1C5693|nr:probable GTP-binding protein OBGM, mitochondrial [Selaginella moellendorffii]|eukprot:XP_024533069.1 probable GTP-binding protein OBGM, mitochondrial [Selaginella moellendorffii]